MAEQNGSMGPIGYLIVEFPANKMNGEGMTQLVDLVERGLIRIIDLAFVLKDEDGAVHAVELQDLGGGSTSLQIFDGASSGLLDEEDLEEGATAIEPGSGAAMLIYENRWATGFVHALRENGAELVAAGFIPQDAILAALDAVEAAAS